MGIACFTEVQVRGRGEHGAGEAMSRHDKCSEPNGGGNVDAPRYEVWEDDNSGGRVAAFQYIDDARAFPANIGGLVYDTQRCAKEGVNRMDFREQLKVLEQAKRDICTIITQLAHGAVQTGLKGIETVIESLTEVSDNLREVNA